MSQLLWEVCNSPVFSSHLLSEAYAPSGVLLSVAQESLSIGEERDKRVLLNGIRLCPPDVTAL